MVLPLIVAPVVGVVVLVAVASRPTAGRLLLRWPGRRPLPGSARRARRSRRSRSLRSSPSRWCGSPSRTFRSPTSRWSSPPFAPSASGTSRPSGRRWCSPSSSRSCSTPSRRHGARPIAVGFFALFLGFQCFAARRHALDYNNDLAFWDATRKAVPRSAKAHLNYSVMLGARGDLEGRLASNDVAMHLAPQWPMASVYEGDTLCRLHRPEEAMPHYLRGFELGPNDLSLIALGLQCLWDEHAHQRGRRPGAHRAAGPGRQVPGLVAEVPGGRHRRERRGVPGRQPQVPAARLQRRPEEGRVKGGPDHVPR